MRIQLARGWALMIWSVARSQNQSGMKCRSRSNSPSGVDVIRIASIRISVVGASFGIFRWNVTSSETASDVMANVCRFHRVGASNTVFSGVHGGSCREKYAQRPCESVSGVLPSTTRAQR